MTYHSRLSSMAPGSLFQRGGANFEGAHTVKDTSERIDIKGKGKMPVDNAAVFSQEANNKKPMMDTTMAIEALLEGYEETAEENRILRVENATAKADLAEFVELKGKYAALMVEYYAMAAKLGALKEHAGRLATTIADELLPEAKDHFVKIAEAKLKALVEADAYDLVLGKGNLAGEKHVPVGVGSPSGVQTEYIDSYDAVSVKAESQNFESAKSTHEVTTMDNDDGMSLNVEVDSLGHRGADDSAQASTYAADAVAGWEKDDKDEFDSQQSLQSPEKDKIVFSSFDHEVWAAKAKEWLKGEAKLIVG
ncbi:hypothetical protein N3K66_000272 [Trichothecium roseum]|uniref:Uncharacterized protein n=1 Tax=Trichothecium roseum TaxID=47278 RepID=A0ACC0VE47_9HYPO|nr:hypothetical protein N3K66_000272 [Trichothecium roseum]